MTYEEKFCPHSTGHSCFGTKCMKFASCMLDEIDALADMNLLVKADELMNTTRELIDPGCDKGGKGE
jgi:hypothetical protein